MDGWCVDVITSKREARSLQGFTCTTEAPRTPGGRRLEHPAPWEREAQTAIRQSAIRWGPGHRVVCVRPVDGEIAGAALVEGESDASVHDVFVMSLGVAVRYRGQGGAVADLLVAELVRDVHRQAQAHGCTEARLSGQVHAANLACQTAMLRNGWEPLAGPPSAYQTWAVRWAVAP